MRCVRILSRSSAITFMRWFICSRASMGTTMERMVANTAIAAVTVAMNCMLVTVSTNVSMGGPDAAMLEFEIDHLAHDYDAEPHPEQAGENGQVAGLGGEQGADVVGCAHVDHDHDAGRK